MRRRKGQAGILGAVLIAFMIIASITTYMFLSSESSKYINTVNKALDRREAKIGERLHVFGYPDQKLLEIENVGDRASHIVAFVLLNNQTGEIQLYRYDLTLNVMDNVKVTFNEMQSFPPYIAGVLTDLGNIFWDEIITGGGGRNNTDIIVISNESITVFNPQITYEFIPPYTLMLNTQGEWFQIYVENVSIVRRGGTKIVMSLDGNIVYIFDGYITFIGNKFITSGEALLGIGYDYIVLSDPDTGSEDIYFSNGSKISISWSNYFGFNRGAFWFFEPSTLLANGSYITKAFVLSDNYSGWIYIKSYTPLAEFAGNINKFYIEYPLISNGYIYAVLNDSELLYSVVFSQVGTYNGEPLYSTAYIGSFTQKFTESAITQGWLIGKPRQFLSSGDIIVGYDNTVFGVDFYSRNYYPGAILAPAWMNKSNTPVDADWAGALYYLGGSDEFPVNKMLWIKYVAFEKNGLYYQYTNLRVGYDASFTLSVVLRSQWVTYNISSTVSTILGGPNNIYPIGWKVVYKVIEKTSTKSTLLYSYIINYNKTDYSQYPLLAWLRDVIGIRRASPSSIELRIINKWGNYDNYAAVWANSSIGSYIDISNQIYQLEVWLYSRIHHDTYPDLFFWPDSYLVAGLNIHSIVFGNYGDGVKYIFPLKPRYNDKNYFHYTDYDHLKDIVVLNSPTLGSRFWVNVSKAIIVVSPMDYPGIIQKTYYEQVGFNFVSPSGLGFLNGIPGVYVSTNGNYNRVEWITDDYQDLDYKLYLYGDYIVLIHPGNNVKIYIYRCSDL